MVVELVSVFSGGVVIVNVLDVDVGNEFNELVCVVLWGVELVVDVLVVFGYFWYVNGFDDVVCYVLVFLILDGNGVVLMVEDVVCVIRFCLFEV